ncbi:hybrid sensor histidine kinase/response regulator [Azospirillum sp. ST 5-10]|uniref:hybrid sensor histidine kinase/response regulator n=1 Tax=unclassified Azospirillum TaxID=2630922 RepID=UPI003F4A04B7
MIARQKIVRVRRRYNQWVANQTLEDYALRFTAESARRWSPMRVANTALGAISFLALEAIGGTVTLAYGFDNAVPAILVAGLVIVLTSVPIAYHAVRYGVDIDLLTRGAGFGYIGSTITSLIYASFTFIFFALEGVILAQALELCFGIPRTLGCVLGAAVVIPLVTHGITFISRFQVWTQPVWVALQLLPFAWLLAARPELVEEWIGFPGGGPAGFDLLKFGAATTVVCSLVAQIGEQVDFLRFLPRREGRPAWWAALLAAGPGWAVVGTLKLLAGSFLVVLALGDGVDSARAGEPTQMYLAAFGAMLPSGGAAVVAVTGVFVIVCQLKINVTNAYAGSLAWSNFFSRLTHSHPGRVVWLVFNVAIATLLMVFGIYSSLEQILALYSVVAIAWVGAMVADLTVSKPLGLSPRHIEFKRAHLYDINPVGPGAMALAVAVAGCAHAGLLGAVPQAFTAFVALGTAFVAAPALAALTRGRYYLARPVTEAPAGAGAGVRCCICMHRFEPADMAFCPAYEGAICSLCCTLDARCRDGCKPRARLSAQLQDLVRATLPASLAARLDSRLGHYLAILAVSYTVLGAVLLLIHANLTLTGGGDTTVLTHGFWMVFVILAIVAGVAAWLFVLAQESRRVAEEESRRQTGLLLQEIAAHERTDAALQKAKEAAEAANLAKTRYVVGISHELRAPLNAILGYAQLLDADDSIPPHRRDAIRVMRRSSEHLSSLIEGLLDISRIEAGHVKLHRDEVRIGEFLEQFAGMFRMQAESKGLGFRYERPDSLPVAVRTDERRLRQILFNLLSNAVKFTRSGHVALRLRYRSQVAEFEVEDSGPGIPPEDRERIFEPFERGRDAGVRRLPGIGLGLTITKLLAEVLGGQIAVSSAVGQGSVFRVKLHLPEVTEPRRDGRPTRAIGYHGRRIAVLVADDDAHHRELLRDLLVPLGFLVQTAPDGATCLELAEAGRPDLVLLDISMPDLDGWEVARTLRERLAERTAIVMVSANGHEYRRGDRDPHDDFLLKPVDLDLLVETIGGLFGLDWTRKEEAPAGPAAGPPARPLPRRHLDELQGLGAIGYVRGILAKLDAIDGEEAGYAETTAALRALVRDFDLRRFMATLEGMRERAE